MAEIIGGIILILSLFGNHHQADKIAEQRDEIAAQTEVIGTLTETNEHNAAEAKAAAETARSNENVVDNIGADLAVCAEKLSAYKATGAIFDARRQADAVTIAALEADLRESGLSSCRVPDGVVDEVTRLH